MSPLNFFVGSSSSADQETPDDLLHDGEEERSSGEEDGEDLDVEDLLWAAQMDLIGHRHPQAVAKLQQAVGLSSSAACATLGNLLSRGLRGEHLSHSCPPDHPSPTLEDPVASGSSGSNPKRPVVLRTMTTPATHAASHDDSIAAAKLFVKGLEFELAKPLEPIAATPRPSMDDSDTEDGAEGRWFSLERALDLIVGLTDSYRFGVLLPPVEGESPPEDDPWGRGAAIAHEILVHPSITIPPPLSSSRSMPPVSTSPRTRSVSRSYAHPSTKLPPPAAAHHQPHLSAVTKLRITVSVHALYLLALHVWPTDKSAAEGYWRDIISIGGSGVGTKEGEEVVERARRRLDGIHRKEGPNEAWHVAKKRSRGRKARRGVTTGTVGVDALGGGADALADIWREKREKEAEWKAHALSGAAHSPPTVQVDRKGKGRATSTDEHPPVSYSHGNTSAITIRANGDGGHSRGPSSLSTSTVSASRTPRPSKFHFAPEPPSDYPSPPSTPEHSPPQPASETPHEGHGIVGVPSLTNTFVTEEPESYFPPQVSTSPDTSISNRSLAGDAPSHAPSLRRKQSRTSLSSFTPSSKLLSRVRSSASVSTLPPDFGSTRPSSPWAREPTTAIGGISFEGALAASGPVERARAISHSGPPLSAASASGSGWRSGWKQKLSSLKESSSRIIEGLTAPKSPPPISAEEVLREMLLKDDESAGPGMVWAVLDEDGMETAHDGEPAGDAEEADGERRSEQPSPSTSKLDAGRLAPSASPVASTSSSGQLSPKPSDPKLRRLNSNLTTRSFVDVTTAAPRLPYQTSTNPPTPERGSRANSHRRVVSSPNLAGAPVEMDPLLLELERQSRVGVKTVCATCGKKGLNYPRARGGGTYCSRDCRVKGLKVQQRHETKGKGREAASVRIVA